MTAHQSVNRKSKPSAARKRQQAQKRWGELNFERLERRELLAAITVSNATDILSPTADTSSIAALFANDGGDGISLREAIAAANNTTGEDTVTFDGSVFTGGDNNLIRLTQGALVPSDSLSIDGSFVGGVTISGDAAGNDITLPGTAITDVDASSQFLSDNRRVLSFFSSGSLTLTGLTITGGAPYSSEGGGIRTRSGNVYLTNSTVAGNSTVDSYASGGGIYTFSGSVSLVNSSVSGNRALGDFAAGGGIFTYSGSVSLVNSTVSDNTSAADGGGIYSDSGVVSLSGSTVSANRTTQGGYSFYSADGGGIGTNSGDLFLSNSTVSGNRTWGFFTSGGGISTSSGDLFLNDSTVVDNSSAEGGGGIRSRSGDLFLSNSTVSGNSSAAGAGGGISASFGDLFLNNSTVSGNSAVEGVGGGISVSTGDLFLNNSTLSGNVAADGGGVASRSGDLSLVNSTVTGNLALDSGGGVEFRGNELVLRNSIVAGNAADRRHPDLSISFASIGDLSNSLIGDTTGSGITASTGIGNILNQAALLGPLADNGGPTLTHALPPGSPAIDAGNNALAVDEDGIPLGTDQRGESRISKGTVDIGAFEVILDIARGLVVTTTQDVEDPNDGITSLREAIALANDPTSGPNSDGDADGDGALSDTITFAPSVFTGGDNSLIRLTQGELVVSDSLTIDARSVRGVVITGDANGDDITIAGTHITDVSASLDETADAPDDLLDDNSRVLYFSSVTGELPLAGLTLMGLTITGGRSQFDGGGISFSGGNVSLTNSTVSGNIAGDDGGGISVRGNSLSLTNSTVSGNIAGEDGGGIYSRRTDSTSLTNSTVSGNSSGRNGGGIWSDRTTVLLANSTVSSNTSGGDGGGGLWWFFGSVVQLVNSTVTGNSTTGVGGGIGFRTDPFLGSNLTLHNSIVAGNTDNGTAPDVQAVSDVANDLTVEHSLIGDATGSGITTATGGGNILNQAALLGPLADNGGPTLTHALPPDSPAINAGNNALAVDENGFPLATDQRGETRISNGTVNIGAVESESAFLLGDVNLDGSVNFLDINPFVSLLGVGSFLDEADIDRNGSVDFLDVNPFASLLSSGGSAQSNLVASSLVAPEISQFIETEPPVSPVVSDAVSEQASIVSGASTVAALVTVETLDAEQVEAEPAKVSPSIATTEPLPQLPLVAPLVLVNDSSAPPADQTNSLSVVDSAVAEVAPVDVYSGPVILTSGKNRSFGDRNLSLRGSGSNEPLNNEPLNNGALVKQRSLAGSEKNLDVSQRSKGTRPTAGVTTDESFSTAAELFDVHPESLDEVFDFELEESLVGLIE